MASTQHLMDGQTARTAALFASKIQRDYAVDEIIAFGSRIRGDNRPDSDLDLAIILKDTPADFIATKLAMADIAFDVLLETGILIQALPLLKHELANPASFSNPALIENIALEGLKIQ